MTHRGPERLFPVGSRRSRRSTAYTACRGRRLPPARRALSSRLSTGVSFSILQGAGCFSEAAPSLPPCGVCDLIARSDRGCGVPGSPLTPLMDCAFPANASSLSLCSPGYPKTVPPTFTLHIRKSRRVRHPAWLVGAAFRVWTGSPACPLRREGGRPSFRRPADALMSGAESPWWPGQQPSPRGDDPPDRTLPPDPESESPPRALLPTSQAHYTQHHCQRPSFESQLCP